MTSTIRFPELVWSEGATCFGVEVAYDLLPDDGKHSWVDSVRMSSQRWVKRRGFKKNATLWIWTAPSLNFPDGPVWAEWIIWFGLPKGYLEVLHADLSRAFPGCIRFSEAVLAREDDGWKAICHIQQGTAWAEVDGDEWAPIELPA